MNAFVDKYEDRIQGVLSCFDCMLFRGYLPIMTGWSMAQLLRADGVDSGQLKTFPLTNALRLKTHARGLAMKHVRPFAYLASPTPKEDAARKIAERDGIEDWLVCIQREHRFPNVYASVTH